MVALVSSGDKNSSSVGERDKGGGAREPVASLDFLYYSALDRLERCAPVNLSSSDDFPTDDDCGTKGER